MRKRLIYLQIEHKSFSKSTIVFKNVFDYESNLYLQYCRIRMTPKEITTFAIFKNKGNSSKIEFVPFYESILFNLKKIFKDSIRSRF